MTLKTVSQLFCTTFWFLILHKHTKFDNKMFYGSGDINLDKHPLKFGIFAVTLTLNAVNSVFHRSLQLFNLYYHTKFGCKLINSLEDIIESHILII